MIELVLATLAIALAVPGIVLAIRALPPISRLVDDGVKPWACDICSCFWITALLVVGAMFWRFEAALCAPPAYTLAMIVLSHMQQPTTLPPPPE